MKNKLLLLLLLSAWGARAQTVPLAQESFETDGEGVRYTSNAFDLRTSAASVAGAFPYFTRALTNPFVNPLNPAYVSFGTNAYPVTIGNVTGRVFWAAEAVESTATTPAATDRPPGVVTLYPINASNYSGLTMTVALADARGPSSPTITQGGLNPQNEANDFIRLQYSTDGGATYNTIGQFLGNNSTGTGQGYMQRDINLDGLITSADGAQSATNTLDINLRDFSFSIPGSPAALLVRVQIDQRGASEELAFDNIRVTGVQNTVAPPALANIENTALNYLEGQAATQITNSLTVTNAAGNLTGATVTISSGRAAAQDVLLFVNQNGITGSFSTSTGVLTLSGTASAATYQAALRSVAYQNTNSANATAGTRTIQFVVANGGTTSGVASRNVVVTSALNVATTLPYQEDFTTDGEGTRYASNTFSNSGTGAAWLRTSANPYQTAATTQTPTTFSGISNSFYWYGNNTNSTANPSRVGTLQTLPINTAGYTNLNFSLLLGASSGANASWQTADYFRVSYRQAGTNTWIPLIQFRGNSTVVAGQGNLQRDADPAATASSPVPTGTTLTPALASFNAYLPVSVYGQTLEFQLVLVADDIRAELAFDNLQLTGTQLAAPTVTTTTPSSITSTSAVLGGSVTNDGGAAVTDRGVVYSSTAASPVIGGVGVTRDANGTGTGSYLKTISGLAPGTVYYVRAYATNSVNTSYGTVISFATPAALATVTTATPAGITGTSATLGGEITATGGATITDRGVVYVLGTGTPTISDTKVTVGTLAGTGTFSQTITGLRGNATYTVRAYATNSAGTAYGPAQTFSTPNNPPTAVNDAATVGEDSGPTTIAVLANDTSAPDINETLTVMAVTQPANGAVSLTGGAVSFTPALDFNGTTTFTYTISDGNGGTATATVTVTVTPLNDAPVVTTTTGNTTFTPGAGAVVVDNGLTLTDVDNTTISSATVSITNGFVSSQDLLSATIGNGISSIYTFATGTLQLVGTATVAQYQAILRSVTYRNSAAAPNTATRTVSFVANDGSLTSAPATKNITFAATTTVASIVRVGASPTNASTVAYTVTFANAVTGLSTGNFTVSGTNLTGTSVASVSGSGTSYTVTVNTGTLSPGTTGTVQLQFNNSTGISPVVTNTGLTGPAYTIDRTPPVVSGVVDGGVYNGSRTISFNEGTATLNGSPFASGSVVSTEGSYTLLVTDAATNTTTVSFTLDLTAPTVVSLTRLSPTNTIATNLTSVTFRVVFSESVTGVAVGDFSLNTGGATGSVTAVSGTGTTYDVTISGIAGNGTLYPDLRIGSVADLAGNLNTTGITSGQFYLIDNIAPETTITANPPAVTNRTTVTFSFTGTDTNGSGVAGFQASLDGAAFAAVSSPVVLSGLADGAHTFRVRALDAAGNVDATPASYTWTVDTSAPTVAISSTAPTPTGVSPIPFTVTFSESVTGFTASDVTVTNGTISTAITNVGNAYSFSVTPATSGLVTVAVAANVAQDLAGNGNAAAAPFSLTYILPTPAPTVTAISPAAGPVGTQVTISGTNLSGATDVRFNGTAASSFVVNSATSITAVVAAGTTTGLVTVTTPGGSATSVTSFVVRVAPTTVADAYSTPAGVTLTGNVLSNDIGTNPRAILINRPTNGTLVLSPMGSFTYVPNAGFSGADSFTYYACDPNEPLLCGNPATVSITVLRIAPVTVADSYSTPQGVTLTGNVLTNDLGTNPRAILLTRPTHGTLVLNPNGSFTYQPAAGFTGLDSFTYYACDPNLPLLCGNPATVGITVGGGAPITVADAYTTPQGVLLTGNVLTNDIGTMPVAILINRPTRGTLVLNPDGSFSYQPAAGYTGQDSFTYYACNMGTPLVCGDPATVSITIGAPINTRTASYQNSALVTATGLPKPAATASREGAVSASELRLTGSPNPFRDQVQLTFALPTTQAYTLAVYDAQGRLVQQLASGQAEAGQPQQVQVSTHLYAEGLYLVRLTTATGAQLLRLVKQ